MSFPELPSVNRNQVESHLLQAAHSSSALLTSFHQTLSRSLIGLNKLSEQSWICHKLMKAAGALTGRERCIYFLQGSGWVQRRAGIGASFPWGRICTIHWNSSPITVTQASSNLHSPKEAHCLPLQICSFRTSHHYYLKSYNMERRDVKD